MFRQFHREERAEASRFPRIGEVNAKLSCGRPPDHADIAVVKSAFRVVARNHQRQPAGKCIGHAQARTDHGIDCDGSMRSVPECAENLEPVDDAECPAHGVVSAAVGKSAQIGKRIIPFLVSEPDAGRCNLTGKRVFECGTGQGNCSEIRCVAVNDCRRDFPQFPFRSDVADCRAERADRRRIGGTVVPDEFRDVPRKRTRVGNYGKFP